MPAKNQNKTNKNEKGGKNMGKSGKGGTGKVLTTLDLAKEKLTSIEANLKELEEEKVVLETNLAAETDDTKKKEIGDSIKALIQSIEEATKNKTIFEFTITSATEYERMKKEEEIRKAEEVKKLEQERKEAEKIERKRIADEERQRKADEAKALEEAKIKAAKEEEDRKIAEAKALEEAAIKAAEEAKARMDELVEAVMLAFMEVGKIAEEVEKKEKENAKKEKYEKLIAKYVEQLEKDLEGSSEEEKKAVKEGFFKSIGVKFKEVGYTISDTAGGAKDGFLRAMGSTYAEQNEKYAKTHPAFVEKFEALRKRLNENPSHFKTLLDPEGKLGIFQ
jgi:DNA repair exonuclease SbcCD ATPase subunit